MSNRYKYRFFLFGALLMAVLWSSCIKEDFGECPRPFQVTIKALDTDNNDITESDAISNVMLFVFNENNQIFKTYTVTGDEIKQRKPIDIHLDYPGHKSLKFVAWANVDDKVDFSPITEVKQLTDLYVKLKSQKATLSTGVIAQSPGDLFFGALDVPVEFGGIEMGKSHVVEIHRKTASVTITARHFPNTEDPTAYSFVLRESPDTYDYNGQLTGNMVNYKPETTVSAEGHLHTPIFITFPTLGGQSYVLDVYKNGELKYTFTQGSDGTPFVPVIGKLLNIIIDFTVDISINVVVTPWGVVFQDVEY